MFNPQEMPNVKAEYLNILDITYLKFESNEEDDIYTIYFTSLKKIEELKEFKTKIEEYQKKVKPFITHANSELRDLLYSCYLSLQEMNESIPKNVQDLKKVKEEAIEKFHTLFENEGGK